MFRDSMNYLLYVGLLAKFWNSLDPGKVHGTFNDMSFHKESSLLMSRDDENAIITKMVTWLVLAIQTVDFDELPYIQKGMRRPAITVSW